MRRAIHVDSSEQTVEDLVGMLHQGAPADDFARRLAEVEALPPSYPGKSTLVETVRMAMAVRNRLELQQQRERGMLAVIESAQDLSSRLDLDEPAERDRLARAQPARLATSRGCRPTTPSAASSTCWSPTARCRRAPRTWSRSRDRGVAGIVMATRLPFTTPDYLHDKRFAHDAEARRHVPRGRHRRAGRRAADLGRRGDRPAVRRRPLPPHAHRAEHSILCTLATHARRRAEERARLRARERGAREGRPGPRRARAARAQHPGRGRRARADDVAAGERRIAGDAVPGGRAAASAAACWCSTRPAQVVSRGTRRGYDGTGGATYAPHGEHSAELARALRARAGRRPLGASPTRPTARRAA